MRHKHADLIIAWAEGAEIEIKLKDQESVGWCGASTPNWHSENVDFRIKPKEPEWWENIPEHGVLVKNKNDGAIFMATSINMPALAANCWIPLTNEEIERFKR